MEQEQELGIEKHNDELAEEVHHYVNKYSKMVEHLAKLRQKR